MPKSVIISGNQYLMSQDETEVLYKDQWYEIQTDQEGDFYIMVSGKTIYLTLIK
jgi:hypothetical protein